jgi:hypothetical protein
MKLAPLIAMCALFGVTATANADPYVVTLEEVGSNVVATGTGSIDLTGLTLEESGTAIVSIQPNSPAIVTGQPGATSFDAYANATFSASVASAPFGSGGFAAANSGSGDLVGATKDFIVVPVGYGFISGSALSDSATYDNATFATLGLTPGVYTWTWGSGADQSFTVDVVSPVPGPIAGAGLPGLIFASGGLLAWWRRKRIAQAI